MHIALFVQRTEAGQGVKEEYKSILQTDGSPVLLHKITNRERGDDVKSFRSLAAWYIATMLTASINGSEKSFVCLLPD